MRSSVSRFRPVSSVSDGCSDMADLLGLGSSFGASGALCVRSLAYRDDAAAMEPDRLDCIGDRPGCRHVAGFDLVMPRVLRAHEARVQGIYVCLAEFHEA